MTDPTDKTILLSGGAGFIGTRLIRRLIDANQIVVLDTLHRNALETEGLADHPNLRLIRGDVRDMDAVRRACEGTQIIIHLASIAGVDTVMKRPVETMEVSLQGTMNMLKAASSVEGLERFVDFSTSEVFGAYAYRVGEGDRTTLGAVGEARWTYAVSKLATEHLATNYHAQYGFPSVAIRPFNIFGPGQVGEGAIHHFVRRAIANEPLIIHNDGAQIRSWCYVDDIVDGVMLTLSVDGAVGQSFNIGNPRATVTIFRLAQEIIRLAESRSKIQFKDWPHPDVELRIPRIDKARRILGYEPKIELEEGLLRTIAWYREQMGTSH